MPYFDPKYFKKSKVNRIVKSKNKKAYCLATWMPVTMMEIEIMVMVALITMVGG